MRGSLGLIVNPVAGMGGKVGLKGTDGAALARARALGAEPVAQARAAQALRRLAPAPRLVTWAGEMGATAAKLAGVVAKSIGGTEDVTTSGADTCAAASAMRGCALVLFAGGDGTARDVHDALGDRVPILGIPTGVKMHSAVFATSPGAAGELASAWLAAAPSVRLREAEVMDVDEAGLADGRLSARLHGYACVPFARHLVQGAKAGTAVLDEAALDALAQEVAAELEPGRLYILGPGTTTRRILARLGLAGTLLGLDAVRDGRLVGGDLGEADLLRLLAGGGPAAIVVGVIGGQGFLFGRGNQPISAEVIRRVGRANIAVLAGSGKLLALDPPCLRVDTGHGEVDRMLAGFIRVRTAPGQAMMMRVVA